MDNKNKTKSNNSSISLAEAMNRTNYWRETVKSLFEEKTDLVPKGFYIPFDDLRALAELYPEASGARAYFTLDKPGFRIGEGVSGILVPVEITKDGVYRDIIKENDKDNIEDTSIYDFTKPCPDCCDPESVLF